MIVRPKATVLDILFTVRGSIAGRIVWRVAAMTALACAAVVWAAVQADAMASLGTAPFTLIGIAISVFMSFRNSACYDRWWEGRKQWGALIVEARSLARELALLPPDHPARPRIMRGVCGFTYGLAARVRDQDEAKAAEPWIDAALARHTAPSPCGAILMGLGEILAELSNTGQLRDQQYAMLEARLHGLTAIQASCERIKATPLPFAYTLLIHRTVYLFCGLLPFALAPHLGWFSPVVVAIVSYTFFGLDAIGDDLAEPFGVAENSLPLSALARVVERDMMAALGVSPLPPELGPVNHLLL